MKQILVAIGAVAAWATTAMADTTLDPDVVLYYDFETMNGEKVVNVANPSVMNGSFGTNSGYGGTLTPEVVEATPASSIRQSMTDFEYETSEKALRNYRDSDTSRDHPNWDGYLVCSPTDTEWFSKTNFTVELFFKTDDGTQTHTPLFVRKGGATVQVNLGIGGTQKRLYVNVSTNTTNQVTGLAGSDFTLGEWHHAALVVNQIGETKTLKAYLDRECVIEKSLDANLTAENSAYKTDWFIGGQTIGNSFGGLIDSVRVTLRALEPDEFLTTRKYPTDATITHVSFEDGTVNADADKYGALTDGTLYTHSGATAPSFSDDVPGYDILDGEGGEVLLHKNGKSISFPSGTSRSYVTYGLPPSQGKMFDTYYLATDTNDVTRTSGTVEFWMKSEDTTYANDTMFVRFINGSKDVWRFRFDSNKLRLNFANTSDGWYAIDADENVLDGKWHHVAFTFAPRSGNEEMTDVKLYVDYGTPKTAVMASGAKMNYVFDSSSPIQLQIGNTYGTTSGYHGLIDELRFSEGALSPSQFLRATHAPGLTIVVR